MTTKELSELNNRELEQRLASLKREQFEFRIKFASGREKDYSQFKKLRQSTARCLTVLQLRRTTTSV